MTTIIGMDRVRVQELLCSGAIQSDGVEHGGNGQQRAASMLHDLIPNGSVVLNSRTVTPIDGHEGARAQRAKQVLHEALKVREPHLPLSGQVILARVEHHKVNSASVFKAHKRLEAR